MADYEREHFTPDTVDEQIDASQVGQHGIYNADPLDREIVRVLQHQYAPTDDHHEPLERVWQRLAQHRSFAQSSQSETTPWELRSRNEAQLNRRNARKLAFKSSESQKTPLRRLGMIAAIVFALLLVGSMLAILQQARQGSKPILALPTPTQQTVVNTDSLYLEVQNTIYRYDAATHRQLWSFSMPLPQGVDPILSPGQVVGNVLYTLGTGSDGYYSYAIDTADGSLRWRFKVDYQSANLNLVGDQLIANGTVYLSEASGTGGYSIVTALDASTGAVRWQQRYNGTGTLIRNQPSDVAAGITLEAATNEVLYGTTFTGKIDSPVTTLFAINAKSGVVLWEKKISTANEQPDYLAGAVVNGILYIPASAVGQPGNRHLYGFDATNGAAKWNVPLDGEVSGLTEFNGVVYAGTIHFQTAQDNSVYAASGSVYAVRAADGTKLWRYLVASGGGVSAPTVQDGIVAVTVSDEKREAAIIALDAVNGNVRWTYPIEPTASSEFPTAPQIAAGTNTLYINHFGGQIQILRLFDGKIIDSFIVPAPDPSSPYGVDILAVVPTRASSS
ncbi:MAG TPA: PQQ-binding-like beta-propeller repeat protein [Ktedonobacteraceae bacterium]|nr:PQQ-binding-like beta-propeller repeat protein [Ktedonobacteraceae bacterium]